MRIRDWSSDVCSSDLSNDAYAWQAHYNVDRSYLINGLNRIMNVGSTAFSYDGRGNLTNDGTNAFTYTAENLLKTGPGGATLAYKSEEHTSELQSLMRISYAVFCLKKKNKQTNTKNIIT